jgi:hypothetical protein
MKGKQIGPADMRGDKGIALIHRIVSDMGFVWNALHLEAGIDGIIEIRNPETAEVSNCILQVQSKAGPSYFKAETESTFEFVCVERDLNYWLAGNAPVILIVSRPDNDEAYWVSVKDYFCDPILRKARKITFDKALSKFTAESRESIAKLALSSDRGLYLPALPRAETLVTNLLPLIGFPKRLFRASTKLRYDSQVWDVIRKHDGQWHREWLLHNSMLYSFHDLTFAPWDSACLSETTDNLSTEQWAVSDDPDKRYVFTRLINTCLRELLFRHGVRYSKNKEHFLFNPTSDFAEKKIGKLSVFKGYESKKVDGRIAYYRHRAMKCRFLRFDSTWYLEITPSYHFTSDGTRLSKHYEQRLTGIKQLERQNKTPLRQLRLWESVLLQAYQSGMKRPTAFQKSLFGGDEAAAEEPIEPYPLIEFGELVTFDVPWGIPETAWLPPGEANEYDDDYQPGLFDL